MSNLLSQTRDELFSELTENIYELLGDIYAAWRLLGDRHAEEDFSADLLVCFQHRIADYTQQHIDDVVYMTKKVIQSLNSEYKFMG